MLVNVMLVSALTKTVSAQIPSWKQHEWKPAVEKAQSKY